MAILKKQKLDTITEYRRQLKFYNEQARNIKVLRKKIILLSDYYKSSTRIDDYIEYQNVKLISGELNKFISNYNELTPIRVSAPLSEEGYEDQFYAIRMATPRGQDYFFDIEEIESKITEFTEIYNQKLKAYFNLYLNKEYKEVSKDGVHYISDGSRFFKASLSLLEDELSVVVSEYFDTGSHDDDITLVADSFSYFLSVRTNKTDYAFGTGNRSLDRFIQECHPHLAI